MSKTLVVSQYLNRQPVAAAGIVHGSDSVNRIGASIFNMLKQV
ncbi:hypothetical protein SAMN02745751_02002 [Dethiosulfatibacter aminovorans DSM 17477]|uniref:Uncharacterized protein n=1 Tax=Dethiosulfatibacter aminovorans DSM 17477 TaxID=1121476 RepID=A0A1M6HFM6_9FIRM|nr:hypothetical protein SAMN02745751_02002 [Dethiosulfatibacter aminovorans DSM 17477]